MLIGQASSSSLGEGVVDVLDHLDSVLVEHRVVLDDDDGVMGLFQDGHELLGDQVERIFCKSEFINTSLQVNSKTAISRDRYLSW